MNIDEVFPKYNWLIYSRLTSNLQINCIKNKKVKEVIQQQPRSTQLNETDQHVYSNPQKVMRILSNEDPQSTLGDLLYTRNT